MQVENVIAFAVDQDPSGLEIRVNFGIFAGRDATSAELEELGKLLVPEAGEVSIVGEQRHESGRSSASGWSHWRRSGRVSASTSAAPRSPISRSASPRCLERQARDARRASSSGDHFVQRRGEVLQIPFRQNERR